MKKRTEETLFQKIVVLIFEIAIAVILLALALVFDYEVGFFIGLPFILAVIFEFFRKDGQNITFGGSRDDSSPYDGELVSYQEYPEENKGVNDSQGFDKYRNVKQNNEMDDLYSGKK